jgi:SpoVK/Ycf46/Vps4 family AAA+-type ATPase
LEKFINIFKAFREESKNTKDRIMCFMSSNYPWNINSKIVDSFEVKLEFKGTTKGERLDIVKTLTSKLNHSLQPADLENIAEMADGFSFPEI